MPAQNPDHLLNVVPAKKLYLGNLGAVCGSRISVHCRFVLILAVGSNAGQVKIIAEASARLCRMPGNNGVCALVVLVGAS